MSTPRLNIGEIVEVPVDPTWEDIERRSLTCPILHQAVIMVRMGHYTREQALMRVALWAANERVRHVDEIVNWLNSTPVPPVVFPK